MFLNSFILWDKLRIIYRGVSLYFFDFGLIEKKYLSLLGKIEIGSEIETLIIKNVIKIKNIHIPVRNRQ